MAIEFEMAWKEVRWLTGFQDRVQARQGVGREAAGAPPPLGTDQSLLGIATNGLLASCLILALVHGITTPPSSSARFYLKPPLCEISSHISMTFVDSHCIISYSCHAR
jgi:hypothetical protein